MLAIVLWLPAGWTTIFAALVAALAARELARLTGAIPTSAPVLIASTLAVLVLALVLARRMAGPPLSWIESAGSTDVLGPCRLTCTVAALSAGLLPWMKRRMGDRLIAVVLAAIYVGLPLGALGWMRNRGPLVLLWLIAVVVVSDSAQYYTGRAFGRHKLAPAISPKKTVEGAIGGVLVATIAGTLLGRVWLHGAWTRLVVLTLAVAIAGILGDLFESLLKRRAGTKDSSALIPGHGGVLDRIDSWLFAAPVFTLGLRYLL